MNIPERYVDDGLTDLGGIKAENDRDAARQNRWRPTAGMHYVRLMPPILREKGQKGYPWAEFYQHFEFQSLARNSEAPTSIRCLSTIGVDCPACEVVKRIEMLAVLPNGQVNREMKDFAWRIGKQKRYVLNIMPVDQFGNPTEGGRVRTWEVSNKTGVIIRSMFTGWGDITRPSANRVLMVQGVQQGRGVQVTLQPTNLETPIPVQNWWHTAPDLEQFVQVEIKSRAEVLAFLSNAVPESHAPSAWPAPAAEPLPASPAVAPAPLPGPPRYNGPVVDLPGQGSPAPVNGLPPVLSDAATPAQPEDAVLRELLARTTSSAARDNLIDQMAKATPR